MCRAVVLMEMVPTPRECFCNLGKEGVVDTMTGLFNGWYFGGALGCQVLIKHRIGLHSQKLSRASLITSIYSTE